MANYDDLDFSKKVRVSRKCNILSRMSKSRKRAYLINSMWDNEVCGNYLPYEFREAIKQSFTLDKLVGNGKHRIKGYIVVSAYKGYYPEDVNGHNGNRLRDEINRAGYAWKRVYGSYVHENGERVFEESFVVFNNYKGFDYDGLDKSFQKLYEFAVRICRLFDQESVMIVEPLDEHDRVYQHKYDVPYFVNRYGEVVSDLERSSNDYQWVSEDEMISYTKYNDKRLHLDVAFSNMGRSGGNGFIRHYFKEKTGYDWDSPEGQAIRERNIRRNELLREQRLREEW